MNKITKKSLFSWLLFDLANTVYAFIIPGLYFSVWLVSEKGWTDQQLGLATSTAMVIVAILGPWIGRKSDSSQGKKKILLFMTLICIISTFLLGTFSVQVSVVLFVFSLIGFNLGSVVYDALLVSVSNEENRGKISGLMGDVAKGIKSFKKGMSDDASINNQEDNSKSDNSDTENK